MTHPRWFPGLVALALTACAAEPAPGYEHALLDVACGPAGGVFPILRLSDAPLACEDPSESGTGRALTAHTAGTITSEDGVVRYDVVSGELCDGSACVAVVGGRLEVTPTEGTEPTDVTYRVELADGTAAAGSAILPVCPRPCF